MQMERGRVPSVLICVRPWLKRSCFLGVLCVFVVYLRSGFYVANAASGETSLAPPAAPEAIAVSANAIRVYWRASADPTVQGYRIWRDGVAVGEAPAGATQYLDEGLQPGTRYRYEVAARAGEVEARSAAVAETTERLWPETLTVDVLVVGGSSAGVGAAVAAARRGARVALLEETNRLGGMISNGLCSTDIRQATRASGVFEEFRQRVQAYYGSGNGLRYEPRVANMLLKEIVYAEPKILVFPHARPVQVLGREGCVAGVVAEDTRTGRRARFNAAQTIDATPEGDVAAWAGCRCRLGREPRSRAEPHAGVIYYYRAEDRLLPGSTGRGDRRMQAYAYLMVVRDYGPDADRTLPRPPGYDPERYRHTTEWAKSWAVTSGRILPDKYEINEHPQGSDLHRVNDRWPEVGYAERTRIAQLYRDHALGFLYFLQTERGLKRLGLADDEFRDNENFPLTLYVREGRRIFGAVTWNERDVVEARTRVQRRSVGIGDYPMDSHAVRPKTDWETPDMGEGEFWLFRYTPWYQVPYGVIVPERVQGLLVPMAVSATHVGCGTLRMEPVRMALGEVAGTAAAYAIRLRLQPRDLPARFLQDKLLQQRVEITWFADVSPATPHYWAIQFLGAQGFFPEEAFRPDAATTRGEAAVALLRLALLERPDLAGLLDENSSPPCPAPRAEDHRSRNGQGPLLETRSLDLLRALFSVSPCLRGEKPAPLTGAAGDLLTREELANWLVRTKQFLAPAKWRVVWPEQPHYADVPRNRPGYAEIETLYAHRIDARLWSGPPLFGDDGMLFHPEATITRADFTEALFLAARDISPLFAELPGEAVYQRP
jgi:hypothetical protein